MCKSFRCAEPVFQSTCKIMTPIYPVKHFPLAAIAHESGDKFSPNLHKWLRGRRCGVWKHGAFDSGDGRKIIGFLDDQNFLMGAELIQILCRGAKADAWAFPPTAGPFVEDVGFWRRYLENGRCALDPQHGMLFLTGERWNESGDTRTCLWCGHRQHLKTWTESVERRRWVNLSINL